MAHAHELYCPGTGVLLPPSVVYAVLGPLWCLLPCMPKDVQESDVFLLAQLLDEHVRVFNMNNAVLRALPVRVRHWPRAVFK